MGDGNVLSGGRGTMGSVRIHRDALFLLDGLGSHRTDEFLNLCRSRHQCPLLNPTLIGSDSTTRRPPLRVDEEALLGLKVQSVGELTVKSVGPNPRSVERVKCPTSQHRSLAEDRAGALRRTLWLWRVLAEGTTRRLPMSPTMARTGEGRRVSLLVSKNSLRVYE
jgi:hypothetical protein